MFDQEEKQRRYDRIKGCLYGVAIGDCLGAPVEFMSAANIQRTYGQVSDITFGFGTDDTAMTLAVAEGLINAQQCNKDHIEQIGKAFVDWFYSEDAYGTGASCSQAISIASKHGQEYPKRDVWFEAAKRAHDSTNKKSAGNGSLMRTAPVALFSRGLEMRKLAWEISAMTHYDHEAGESCCLYCDILSKLIRGHDLCAAVSRGLEKSAYKYVYKMRPKPTGYVKDTFQTALWGVWNNQSFKDTLIAVVNCGGDADTTGAVAGGLAGAAYGFKAIPDKWVQALDKSLKTRLNAVVDAAARYWDH